MQYAGAGLYVIASTKFIVPVAAEAKRAAERELLQQRSRPAKACSDAAETEYDIPLA